MLEVILFYTLAVVTVIMVLKQGLSRKVELFSIRNLYLAGFLIYHVIGPTKALLSGNYMGFTVNNPESTGRWLLFYVWVYFLVYLFSYHRIKLVRWFAAKMSVIPSEGSDSMFLALAMALVTVGIPMRLFARYIPVVGPALINVSLAMAAVACALAGWVWSYRKFNPAVLGLTGFIVAAGIGISVFGIFGRRPLVGVLFGFAWGAYYRWARYVAPGKLILYMFPIMVGATIVISAFSAVRGELSKEHTAQVGNILHAMIHADIQEGSQDVASGQGCAGAMMWALEQYPRYLEPKPLFSLKYMVLYFVPRQLWPDKPEPLSTTVATLARLEGVNRDKITIPPGVAGYAAAEGGFYALIIYALFFGQFTRFFDEIVCRNPFNPFIVLPAGCVTGQFLGLARGDISSFTDIIVVGFVATMALMFVAKLFFGKRAMPQPGMQWYHSG